MNRRKELLLALEMRDYKQVYSILRDTYLQVLVKDTPDEYNELFIPAIKHWFEENVLPELEVGMFVAVDNSDPATHMGKGIVCPHNLIVFQNGTYESISSVKDHIVKVWGPEVHGFNQCKHCTPIWQRD